MNRVRVLHLVVGGDIGGAERLLVDLATRRDETGADHEIALFTPNPKLHAFFEAKGLRVHKGGEGRESPLTYLQQSFGRRACHWLSERIVTSRAQVLHTHTFGSHVLGSRAALATHVPQLRTEHHVVHYFDWDTRPFTRWAAARTDRFAAISDYVLETLRETSSDVRARGVLVRNGVDTDYFRETGPPDRTTGATAVIACRLTAWKRVELAVRASKLASVPLTVLGAGEERAPLEAVANEIGAPVTFAGRVEDTRPFLSRATMVLSTSKQEPFGLSIVEALSVGRPVVAIAGGGVRETVRDGWGIVVDEATPEALAAAMVRLRDARTETDEMGARGREFAVRECSAQGMCAGYAALYRELAERS